MSEERRFEAILDAVPGAFLTVDEEMRVTWLNRAAAGWVPMLTEGVGVREALSPIVGVEKLDRLLLLKEKIAFRTAPEQPELQAMLSPTPLDDNSGLLMIWETSVAEYETDRRTTFIMGASHELRSPLTAVVGFSEILQMDGDGLSPSQAEAAAVIHQNALHLRDLVDSILDMSQNSFGELHLQITPVDLATLVGEVVDSVRPGAEEKGQALKLEVEPGLPEMEADAGRLRQVVLNLVENAVAHTPPGSKIAVTVSRAGDRAEVKVEDNGPGLQFDDPNDAFEPFRRGPSSNLDTSGGSGIGLAMVGRLVELHRGTISVSSEPGSGAAFTVSLPFERAEDPDQGAIGLQ
jgi:signal transduction histidine kinase